ncbi:HAD-IA family hydrolase [Synechococcales cyanobacterium C]|uniref:HAD-IA family hydrolase n=2 Tax=Petrachloros TaxID=2918834 RepID=A0A8K2A8Z4_9CYAN|nr:HAD-IA family hydrolase [Petrachloros mirabilis ULC683]
MPQLQALIFDVDGTLAETERDGHRVAFNRAFAEAGLDWHWSVEQYGELLTTTGGKERIYHYLQHRNHIPPEFSGSDPMARIAALHEAKNRHYQDLLTTGAISLRPGVARLLTEARDQSLRLAIATTSTLPNAMALLEQTLNPGWFEVIAAGDIVSAKKPAPDIYTYVLDQLQLPPQDCLVVEDSAQGLKAALAAGLTTLVTANPYTQTDDLSGAALVVDSLGDPDQPLKILKTAVPALGTPPLISMQTVQQIWAAALGSPVCQFHSTHHG